MDEIQMNIDESTFCPSDEEMAVAEKSFEKFLEKVDPKKRFEELVLQYQNGVRRIGGVADPLQGFDVSAFGLPFTPTSITLKLWEPGLDDSVGEIVIETGLTTDLTKHGVVVKTPYVLLQHIELDHEAFFKQKEPVEQKVPFAKIELMDDKLYPTDLGIVSGKHVVRVVYKAFIRRFVWLDAEGKEIVA